MASAAGLLIQIGDAACPAPKHAAVGNAEFLSIMHAGKGIRVSLISPQKVAFPCSTLKHRLYTVTASLFEIYLSTTIFRAGNSEFHLKIGYIGEN